MNNKRLAAVLVLIAVSAAVVLFYAGRRVNKEPSRRAAPDAGYRPAEEKLRGRDFVRLGEPGSVEGNLKMEHGEWFIVSEGQVYELHLGDHVHRADTGIKLEEGIRAYVTGFFYAREGASEIDIAVCAVELDGELYRFRDDDGSPLWRGSGSGDGPGRRR